MSLVSDKEIVDWLADSRIIEGLGYLLEDIHDYAMHEVVAPDAEPGANEYRTGFRKMMTDAITKIQEYKERTQQT